MDAKAVSDVSDLVSFYSDVAGWALRFYCEGGDVVRLCVVFNQACKINIRNDVPIENENGIITNKGSNIFYSTTSF